MKFKPCDDEKKLEKRNSKGYINQNIPNLVKTFNVIQLIIYNIFAII